MLVPVVAGSRIPDLLAQIGKNQIWLSETTGIHESRISEIINLKVKNPNLSRLKMIAKALKCRIDDLYVWRWESRARRE